MKNEVPKVITEDWLHQLDVERLRRPKRVIKLIEKIVRGTEPALLPLLYLVYGAALRQTTRLGDARWAFSFGIFIVEHSGNLSLRARLIRRLAWVEAAEGDFAAAHERVQEALTFHTMLNEREEAGKALVSQGILFFLQEDHKESNFCMHSSLERLNSRDIPNRFAAHQHLAMSYRVLGGEGEAIHHLAVARKLGQEIGQPALDKLLWHEANIREESGKDSSATLEKIVENSLKEDNFLDAALGTLQLAKGHLKEGRYREAQEAGVAIRAFAFNTSCDAAAAAALEVYRSCLNSALTMTEINQAIQKIEKIRGAHLTPRSLIND